MNTKGQGALEYLLIIGGAVIVAGIVLTMLITTAPGVQSGTDQSLADSVCAKLTQTDCGSVSPGGGCAAGDCKPNSTKTMCIGQPTASRSKTCFNGTV